MAQGKISKKQLEILEYIKSQILERGFPPAVREICEAVNLKSTSSVHSHLETLEKNGYLYYWFRYGISAGDYTKFDYSGFAWAGHCAGYIYSS